MALAFMHGLLYEVVHGGVKLRRIDGKDGVAGSIPAGLHHKPAAQVGYNTRSVA